MISRMFRYEQLHDPRWAQFLFGNLIMAPIWTLVRLYVGWQWLQAGWHKVTGDGWVNQDGSSLQGFWERIVVVPEQGSPAIRYGWYRDLRRYGTVPHAGFGLGLERTVVYVAGLSNVRDAIPFPRTPGNARY